MGRFKAGKPGPSASLAYTAEQYARIHSEKLELCVLDARGDRWAKPELVNHLLAPDGELRKIEQDDADAMMAAALAHSPEKATEVAAALKAERFLFIIDEQGLPLIYFNCAIKTNPEYVPASPKRRR